MYDELGLLATDEAEQWSVEFESAPPEVILQWALNRWDDQMGICTSFQAEGMVILDMACRMDRDVHVFTIDTGRLHQRTYEFIDRVRDHYGIDIHVYFPDTQQVEDMVKNHGTNLFYKSVDSRQSCCHIRKVEPLRRALKGLDAWVTGLRRDQWISRAQIRKVDMDHDHDGITKICPLADWTSDEVWNYIETHDVPVHPLYAQGYTSIGCGPCTRPVQPGENARSGRWWWEKNASKECGIHCVLETSGTVGA